MHDARTIHLNEDQQPVAAALAPGIARVGASPSSGGDTAENGTITITGYTGPGGDVVIPDTINGLPVSDIGEWAFRDCYSLNRVMIPDGVTSIGDWAFSICPQLTSVSIPKSVASIGLGTFYGCSSLAAIMVDPLNPVYNSLDGVLFDRSQAMLIQFPGGNPGTTRSPMASTVSGLRVR